MVTEIHIDLLKKDDIPAVTEIIITTLKKSLIQKLGTEFIKKHFLPAVISHPELTNYVCRYENKIIGFLLFANTQQSMQSLGKEIFLPLIRYAFIKSFVSPSILLDLITSFYNPTSIEENAKSHYYQSVYLVYFCIVKSMQCKGIGAYVLKKCLRNFSPANCIVETSEQRAMRFYEKQQFIKIGHRKRGIVNYPLFLKTCEE